MAVINALEEHDDEYPREGNDTRPACNSVNKALAKSNFKDVISVTVLVGFNNNLTQ